MKSLTLSVTALDRDWFRLLAGMTGVEYLSLESTQATDTGVAHLAGLAKLTYLGYNPGATDDGLKHLTGLRWLTGLLYGTKVTDGGAAELKGALSKLKIGKENARATRSRYSGRS